MEFEGDLWIGGYANSLDGVRMACAHAWRASVACVLKIRRFSRKKGGGRFFCWRV